MESHLIEGDNDDNETPIDFVAVTPPVLAILGCQSMGMMGTARALSGANEVLLVTTTASGMRP